MQIPFIYTGLSFLYPTLSTCQFNNMVLIATALVLGSKFSLSEINTMWLEKKCISTLSYFLSHSKISPEELQLAYLMRVIDLYKVSGGYFIIDDTMQHHTNYCKWIHGVFVLFDHALKTNLRATCVVVLYHSNGNNIKFPIKHEIYYKDTDKMDWQKGVKTRCIPKHKLAIQMIEWALNEGFPKCVVLADAWFGIGPFVKELKRLKLSYVLEIKSSYKVKVPSEKPKLTPKGRVAKNQFDLIELKEFFNNIARIIQCGFAADPLKNKPEKVLYHTKTVTNCLNSIPGMHRIVQSIDPQKCTVKYLITDNLTWEASRILSTYNHRWVIEEFFRNAKQLSDMEGATIRSKQGVTLALCLVSWIDFLLHYENYKHCTAGKLPKESLTIPSIVRRVQYENIEAFVEKVQKDEGFVKKWLEVAKKDLNRKRKRRYELINMGEPQKEQINQAA